MSVHLLEATREIPINGQYIPNYKRQYFMLWKDLPTKAVYGKVYQKRLEDRIIRKVFIELVGYEDESKQTQIYWNAIGRAKYLLRQ
jgi:hypothetical protein